MSSTGAGYDLSSTTFSPDGRIFQVEYAGKAVENSGTAIGVRCQDGVILAVEKLMLSKMLVRSSNRRIHSVDTHCGLAMAGLVADGRQLVNRAREECRAWKQNYGDSIPVQSLCDRMSGFMHFFTLNWYLRPFGSSIIIAGYDAAKQTPELYMVDPSGVSWRYYGVAIGKGTRAASTEIEKLRLSEMTCREALGHIAKIIHITHEESREKEFELEMSWVCAETGWEHQLVPDDLRNEAIQWAIQQIEADDEDGDE